MKIVIIANGDIEKGMGHIYRSLSLADELKKYNDSIVFLTKSDGDVIKKINNHNIDVIRYKDNNDILKIKKNIKPDVIIIDDLEIEEEFAKNIKDLCNKLVLFDNSNPSSNKYADVVVNVVISRSGFKNRKYVDEENKTLYLYGPKYLILRDEFYKAKEISKRRINKEKTKNILITFGGSDSSNLTCMVLKELSSNLNGYFINVVLGPKFSHTDKLNDILVEHNIKNKIKIYKNINNMAELMKNVDLIITSPGMTMFEALFLGISVVVLYQNELQKKYYDNHLKKIFNKENTLLRESYYIDDRKLDNLHIGKGKLEIIESIRSIDNYEINTNFKIMIRQVTDSDLELLMAWRSNPLIYKFFYIQKEPLKWDEHYSWWISRENRIDWMILIEESNIVRRIGSVNVSQLDTDNPEIGVFIGELCLWGKHIGRYLVLRVLKWLKNMEYKRTHVRILENNFGSIKLFESLGFKKSKKGRVGEWIYEKVCDYGPHD